MGEWEDVTEKLLERRGWAFDGLKSALIGLKDCIEEVEKKVKNQGLDARYSVNSDVLRWARRVHSAEHNLSILHELLVYTTSNHGIIEVSRKEIDNVQEEASKETQAAELDSSSGSLQNRSGSSQS